MQLRYIEIPAWSELSSPAVQQLKDARIRWIRKRERKINKINGVCRCSFSCSAIAFFGPGPGRFWSLEVTVPQSHALGTTPFAAPLLATHITVNGQRPIVPRRSFVVPQFLA